MYRAHIYSDRRIHIIPYRTWSGTTRIFFLDTSITPDGIKIFLIFEEEGYKSDPIKVPDLSLVYLNVYDGIIDSVEFSVEFL